MSAHKKDPTLASLSHLIGTIELQPRVCSGTGRLHGIPMHQELPQAVRPTLLVQAVHKRLPARHLRSDNPDFTIKGRISIRRVEQIVELSSCETVRIPKDAATTM